MVKLEVKDVEFKENRVKVVRLMVNHHQLSRSKLDPNQVQGGRKYRGLQPGLQVGLGHGVRCNPVLDFEVVLVLEVELLPTRPDRLLPLSTALTPSPQIQVNNAQKTFSCLLQCTAAALFSSYNGIKNFLFIIFVQLSFIALSLFPFFFFFLYGLCAFNKPTSNNRL